MDLLPARRGCLHYGALSLPILLGVCGLALGIWGCSLGVDIWLETVGPTFQYTEADVLSDPATFMKAARHFRAANIQVLKTIASFCSAATRLLIFILALAVISAATTPGPRHPRQRAWMGVFGIATALLLFHAGSRVAPSSEPAPLPAMQGRELYELIGTELDRMETGVYAFFALTVATTIFFGAITLRSALRLRRGVREERRRRREEAETLLVGQF